MFANMKQLIISLFLFVLFLPANAQKDLVSDKKIHFAEKLDPAKCEKERDKKTPMALLHVEIPGLSDANITEENNFIKGNPVRTANGWDLWVTTNTKKTISLKIYTDQYKPLVVKAEEKLESAKKYILTAKIPDVDVNAGKVYVLVDVNTPCELTVTKDDDVIEKISFTESKLDTLLHLPYGGYIYSAKASNRYEDIGSLILSDVPVEKSIVLRSNLAKLTMFSEKGTRLFVDGKEQVAIGDTTVANKKLGDMKYALYETLYEIGTNHTLLAKGSEGLEDKRSITIKTGANVCDMHINGSLEISKPKGADIVISKDTTATFRIPHMIQSALGTYNVTYKKYGYADKTEAYYVGIRKNERPQGPKYDKRSRIIAPFGFINYTYSPSAPIGLMFGYAKRWGVYGSIKTSVQFWKSFSIDMGDATIGHDNAYATSVKNAVMPEDWKDYYVDPSTLEKREPYRFSASVGVMKSITYWLYLYAGVGYGHYKTLYENPNPLISAKRYDDAPEDDTYYKDRFFSTYNLKGLEADGGIMVNLRSFNLTAGWTHLFGSTTFGDFNVGIGINLHK